MKAPAEPRWLGPAALGGRFLVGAVFILSGFSKAVSPPQEFAAAIEAYQVMPPELIPAAARALPWAELVLGAFLLAGYWRRISALGLATLLFAFLWALVTAQIRGLEIGECGCYGRFGPKLKPWQATLSDLAFLALALSAWRERSGPWTLDRWIDGSPS